MNDTEIMQREFVSIMFIRAQATSSSRNKAYLAIQVMQRRGMCIGAIKLQHAQNEKVVDFERFRRESKEKSSFQFDTTESQVEPQSALTTNELQSVSALNSREVKSPDSHRIYHRITCNYQR
jgi:hypothetical protein